MAGLENLAAQIYHERQQPGSMLCAQHALNNLLQWSYFTAPDLSEIAKKLDTLEQSYDTENEHGESRNMDDTGFFSVQVLENALQHLGLNLMRWRSEEMRPYQDHPHTQLAFILNLEQHWFTLRRFGSAVADINNDPGDGHWFNLNSFLAEPEWVSKTYLGMVLQQAEAEGYSVFAITQIDPQAPLALPRTTTDQIASTLPEPTSAVRPNPQTVTARSISEGASTSRSSGVQHHRPSVEGFEDEDYELQAALQASLMGASTEPTDDFDFDYSPPTLPAAPALRASVPLPRSDSISPAASTPQSGSQTPLEQASQQSSMPASDLSLMSLPGHADVDPVTASMERNRVLLQRMREQQEFAQQELWSGAGLEPEEAAALEERRQERRRREQEEEEQIRRAIMESEAMYGSNPAEKGEGSASTEQPEFSRHNLAASTRVYDDDDAELQAALKASLESVPEGYQHPELAQQPMPSRPAAPTVSSTSRLASASQDVSMDEDHEEIESIASDEMGTAETNVPEPVQPPSLDEIRKARLARFGL
ncbi:Josephin-domain-containing protein [Crucibulum laeve]|uniref:ubiquitinyl hydrolase 1 n=1 Tax=Crucibulum laeve TaxID=68775 RepID=A0A5C3MTK4_9AGAR|nr:Josephin-domain-containing protein [Crucibulum laeve]